MEEICKSTWWARDRKGGKKARKQHRTRPQAENYLDVTNDLYRVMGMPGER